MINKRIIFGLLYSKGVFYLSRNFRLQKVGDISWIEKNYNFHKTCEYVDELAFILVTRDPDKSEIDNFFKDVDKVRKKVFSPVVLGGGIRDIEHVKKCFDNGADKILINSKILDQEFINNISEIYGSQAISLVIDYKVNNDGYDLYLNCGREKQKISMKDILNKLKETNYGEMILHSMDKDGTGNGYDLEILHKFNNFPNKPILLMGGGGKPEHILEALKLERISGVVTANIFNFIGNGLKITRENAIKEGIKVVKLV